MPDGLISACEKWRKPTMSTSVELVQKSCPFRRAGIADGRG
jgi:hypothetical protein